MGGGAVCIVKESSCRAVMAPAAVAKAEAALSELLEVMEQGDTCMEPATLERLLELAAATTKRLTAASTRGGDGPESGRSTVVGAREATATSNDLSAALDALSLGGPASTHAPGLPQAGEAAVALAVGDRVYFKAASGEAPRSGHVVGVHRELSYTLRGEAGELFERWPAASVKPPKVRSSRGHAATASTAREADAVPEECSKERHSAALPGPPPAARSGAEAGAAAAAAVAAAAALTQPAAASPAATATATATATVTVTAAPGAPSPLLRASPSPLPRIRRRWPVGLRLL